MKENTSTKEKILEWIKSIVVAVAIAFIISNYVIVNAVVPTGSMEETINVGDRLIANRLSYIFSDPERGDIIVFDGTDTPEKLYVKRIIGLPGETINISDGIVKINEIPLEKDFTDIEVIGNFGPFTVPEDHYFMLGDNRNRSNDSRYWINKYVPIDAIKGKVNFKYFPKVKLFN